MRGRLTLAVVTIALGTKIPAAIAQPLYTLPAFEYARYGFTARAADATAIFLNPAGLGGGPGTNLYVDVTGNSDGMVEWAAALQGKGLGFAYRHREPLDDLDLPVGGQAVTDDGNLDTYTFAGSYGSPKLKLGISVVWSKTTLPGEDGFSGNAGFQSALSTRVGIGAMVESIQHPDFLDGELRPRYRYGITVAALPGKLIADIQGSHEDGSPDLIALQYGLRLTVQPEWAMSGVLSDRPGEDPTYGFSLTYLFGRGTVSGRGHTLSGNDDFLGQLAIQAYDEFWQQGTQPPKPSVTRIGGRHEE